MLDRIQRQGGAGSERRGVGSLGNVDEVSSTILQAGMNALVGTSVGGRKDPLNGCVCFIPNLRFKTMRCVKRIFTAMKVD